MLRLPALGLGLRWAIVVCVAALACGQLQRRHREADDHRHHSVSEGVVPGVCQRRGAVERDIGDCQL